MGNTERTQARVGDRFWTEEELNAAFPEDELFRPLVSRRDERRRAIIYERPFKNLKQSSVVAYRFDDGDGYIYYGVPPLTTADLLDFAGDLIGILGRTAVASADRNP